MSNTGWTPAVPGHTTDRTLSSDGSPTPTARDSVAEQVVDLKVDRRGDVVVVQVGGEVDMLTTPMLTTLVNEQLGGELSTLVLDLRGVGFLGSSGLASLVQAREAAAGRGVRLRLVSASHSVLRPLTATGLAELFEIYPDLDAAVAD
ncbi:MAG TPA: STAS domain-containing protein [Pseudonocardiaceae bacterium]